MKAREINSLKEVNTDEDWSFTIAYREFTRDNKIRTFFERVFGGKLKAVYVSDYRVSKIEPFTNSLDIGGRYIIIFREDGQVVEMTNSEWGSITLLKS